MQLGEICWGASSDFSATFADLSRHFIGDIFVKIGIFANTAQPIRATIGCLTVRAVPI